MPSPDSFKTLDEAVRIYDNVLMYIFLINMLLLLLGTSRLTLRLGGIVHANKLVQRKERHIENSRNIKMRNQNPFTRRNV